MKYLVYGLLTLTTLQPAMANDGLTNSFYNVSQRLESTINNLSTVQEDQSNRYVPAQIPWSISESRERAFWKSFITYYDYLSASNSTRRHMFIYGFMKANTLSTSELRVKEMAQLLRIEEKANSKLSYDNFTKWKNRFSPLQLAFNELKEIKPTQISAFVPPLPLSQSIQELKSLKLDIDQLVSKNSLPLLPEEKKAVVSDTVVKNTPKQKPTLSTGVLFSAIQQTDFQIIFSLVGLFIVTLYFLGRPRKFSFTGLNVPESIPEFIPEFVPEFDEKLEALLDKIEMEEMAPMVFVGVSVEEKCKKLLEENKHLLDVANLKVHSYARSPFDSRVNASEETITEAISHLIKGTLAIANASSQKATFMEWNCKEQSGRVSLEFTLHGIDCDSQFLYMNALMDGEGSAPAFFGKTERTLDSFLPSVGIRSANKRTVVSLGLDNRAPVSLNN